MLNVNEGKRAIRTSTKETCSNCGAVVKCEDGKPTVKCCGNFEKK
jgi:hypothetical protein